MSEKDGQNLPPLPDLPNGERIGIQKVTKEETDEVEAKKATKKERKPKKKKEPPEEDLYEYSAEELAQKEEAIKIATKAIEKQFGRGSIMDMGSSGAKLMVEVVPTGSISLDEALVIGGYPRGRIIEIYGKEASGKTSLALHAIAEAQKRGGKAFFIDAEHALDINYAKNLGVRIDKLLISQPDFGEQALDIADMMIRSGGMDIVVVDSVAALVPKAELDGDMGDSQVALQARLMSKALRKLSSIVSSSRTIVIFINQIRHTIGKMFGSPEVTTGGNALKFYASVRLDIRSTGKIKDGEKEVGHETRVKVVKNKLAPPFRVAEFPIIWGEGVCSALEVLDMAEEYGVVKKTGAVYYYGEETLGRGRMRTKEFLRENPKIIEILKRDVFEKLK